MFKIQFNGNVANGATIGINFQFCGCKFKVESKLIPNALTYFPRQNKTGIIFAEIYWVELVSWFWGLTSI